MYKNVLAKGRNVFQISRVIGKSTTLKKIFVCLPNLLNVFYQTLGKPESDKLNNLTSELFGNFDLLYLHTIANLCYLIGTFPKYN